MSERDEWRRQYDAVCEGKLTVVRERDAARALLSVIAGGNFLTLDSVREAAKDFKESIK